MTNHPGPGIPRVDFLVCPSASLLEQFVHRPFDLDPGMVRAVSRHLGRCALCREEADGVRRSREASIVRRPWGWSLAGLFLLALSSAAFLVHELHDRGGGPLHEESPRPDARMAALARFDPPDEAGLWATHAGDPATTISPEDRRQLAAAREMLDSDRPHDAAGLLKDLSLRHPRRGAIRLMLAYALARSGDFEGAWSHYRQADAQGMGDQACWGVVNACLRLGDIPCARRELSEHLLVRSPDDEEALDLLGRISSSRSRAPR